MAVVPAFASATRLPWIRTQDIVWLLLFSAMAYASPVHDAPSIVCILALAALQVAEPRIRAFDNPRGNLAAIAAKLVLCWLIIGYTDAINSSYYTILLLPVVSAATTAGPIATVLVTLLACLAYLSFLLFIDWSEFGRYLVAWEELMLRIIFLPVVGYLTYTLARANRIEAERSRVAAENLAAANLSLHAAQDAIRRSERLAALGQLTAGLAHELRNPMGTIRASAEMLTKQLPAEGGVAREMAGFIVSEVDRANSLVSRFLEFARPLSLHLAPTELHEVLDRAVTQLEAMGDRAGVLVIKNYDPSIRPVPLDGEWMERVVYNLLLNAVQASPPGATVTLRTRPAGEDAIEIAVLDRGSGIADAHRQSIFNPFFTTKKEGVGLGLAIVAKIVDEHGGTLAVDSEPGKGSTFRILLPARMESASQ